MAVLFDQLSTRLFKQCFIIIALLPCQFLWAQQLSFSIPKCSTNVQIDGDLSDWKAQALSNGTWNINRVQTFDWFNTKRNKLTLHTGEDTTKTDLAAQYYIAWTDSHLLLGAEVTDNNTDVSEAHHEPKRWYYKDAIAWFFEIPNDTFPEKFEEGNHGFAFVADSTYPDYGAWWRHGTSQQPYLEEPIPADQVEYTLTFDRKSASYVLEAKINICDLLNTSILHAGQSLSMMIVHCDPDGAEYGGHMLIYGKGDLDSTWSVFTLTDDKDD